MYVYLLLDSFPRGIPRVTEQLSKSQLLEDERNVQEVQMRRVCSVLWDFLNMSSYVVSAQAVEHETTVVNLVIEGRDPRWFSEIR